MALFRRETPSPSEPSPGGHAFDSLLDEVVAARTTGTIAVEAIPAVHSARTLIADTVAQLPLVAMRGGVALADQPAILTRPDPTEPAQSTMHRLVASLTRHGNALVEVTARAADGHALACRVLPWQDVAPTYGRSHRTVVAWRLHAEGRTLAPADVVHIPLTLDPGPLGRSPLQACGEALADAATLYNYAASYYRAGGVPSLSLSVPGHLSDDQADRLLAGWIEARRKARPALLQGGVTLNTDQPSAADALLLDGLGWVVAEVGRAFGVPPSLINAPTEQSLTYATTVDERDRWLALSLQPTYLARIEGALSDLLPRGQSARFDVAEFLRPNFARRADAYETALRAGWLTIDEVRSIEGRPPLTTEVPTDA